MERGAQLTRSSELTNLILGSHAPDVAQLALPGENQDGPQMTFGLIHGDQKGHSSDLFTTLVAMQTRGETKNKGVVLTGV